MFFCLDFGDMAKASVPSNKNIPLKETHFLNSMPKEGNSEQEMTSEQIAEMIEEEEMPFKSEVKLEIDEIFLPPEQSMYNILLPKCSDLPREKIVLVIETFEIQS